LQQIPLQSPFIDFITEADVAALEGWLVDDYLYNAFPNLYKSVMTDIRVNQNQPAAKDCFIKQQGVLWRK
jgi:hypothetical protein